MGRFTEEEMAEPDFKDGKLYWCVFGLLQVSQVLVSHPESKAAAK